jgi:hypothetical protein
LVGKPEGKRPPGRPRRKWVENIKIDLRETGWDGMDWIDLAQDRVISLQISENAEKFLSSYTINIFSRRVQLRK